MTPEWVAMSDDGRWWRLRRRSRWLGAVFCFFEEAHAHHGDPTNDHPVLYLISYHPTLKDAARAVEKSVL